MIQNRNVDMGIMFLVAKKFPIFPQHLFKGIFFQNKIRNHVIEVGTRFFETISIVTYYFQQLQVK